MCRLQLLDAAGRRRSPATLPGFHAGHVSNLEQPERFNEAVREVCRIHSPRLA